MLSVNQALAAVTRQTLPQKARKKLRKLKKENEIMKQILEKAEIFPCSNCDRYRTFFGQCEGCDRVECYKCCVDFGCLCGAYNCKGCLCSAPDCNLCGDCSPLKNCFACLEAFCQKHLFFCDQCQHWYCGEHNVLACQASNTVKQQPRA